jgi:hypothetical protein
MWFGESDSIERAYYEESLSFSLKKARGMQDGKAKSGRELVICRPVSSCALLLFWFDKTRKQED